MKKSLTKKAHANGAFSLVELSIVILIVGIITAGVTSSSSLVRKFRISSAQSLTKGSIVNGINGLSTWYETSLDESFLRSEISGNTAVGLPISTWIDANSQQVAKNNLAQSVGASKPKYYTDVLNGLPGVRFDGLASFMTFDGMALAGTNYTIFIVEQRRAGATSSVPRALITGSNETDGNSLVLSYSDSTKLVFGHYGSANNMEITTAIYASPRPTIHTFRFSSNEGKQYWSNGGSAPDASISSTTQNTALASFAGAQVGRSFSSSSYYSGDIFEIIIFANALNKEDRQSIEEYLAKKYNLTII